MHQFELNRSFSTPHLLRVLFSTLKNTSGFVELSLSALIIVFVILTSAAAGLSYMNDPCAAATYLDQYIQSDATAAFRTSSCHTTDSTLLEVSADPTLGAVSRGERGPKGDDGATGAKGEKGDKGDTGLTGAAGSTGLTGSTGATGADGAAASIWGPITGTLSDQLDLQSALDDKQDALASLNISQWTNDSAFIGRTGLSSTATGLSYDNGTGVFSLTAGSVIPSTTEQTNWNSAFGWGNHAGAGYITDGNTGWNNSYGLITAADTLTGLVQSTAVGTSYITGGNVGIGTTAPGAKLELNGATSSYEALRISEIGFPGYNWSFYYNNTQSKLSIYPSAPALSIGASLNLMQNGGNVGIGTTAPATKLSIAGTGSANGITLGSDQTYPATIYHSGTYDSGADLTINAKRIVTTANYLNFPGTWVSGLLYRQSNEIFLGTNIYFLSSGGIHDGTHPYIKAQGATTYSDLSFFTRNSVEGMRLTNAGNVGIGTTSPTSILHTVASGAKTADYVGNLLTNTATSSTASVVKTGLSVTSTGTWDGTTAVNRGLYVNATGGTTNYAAIFEGGNVGIGTTAPSAALDVTGVGKFTGQLIANDSRTNAVGLIVRASAWTNTQNIQQWYDHNNALTAYMTSSGQLNLTAGSGQGVAVGNLLIQGEDNRGIYMRNTHPLSLSSSGANPVNINAGSGDGTGGLQVGLGNGSIALTVAPTSGNVGIGTTSPGAKLQITQASDVSYPTLGTAKGAFFIAGNTNLFGLYTGINTGDGSAWMQSMRNDGATAYNIILNPVGGSVGIGTTSPVSKLSVTDEATPSNRGFTISQNTSNTAAPLMNFRKSRGTAGTPLTVANGDYTTSFTAQNYDGTAYVINGNFGYKVNGTVGTNSVPGEWFFATSATNDTDPYANGTVKMVINPSGNVGIGTTAPNSSLHVVGSNDGAQLSVQRSVPGSSSGIQFKSSADTGTGFYKAGIFFDRHLTNGRGYLTLAVNDVDDSSSVTASNGKLSITHDGLVGVGTNVPLSRFGVAGNASIGATYGLIAAPASGMIIEGNVGIGTTAPGAGLEVATAGAASSPAVKLSGTWYSGGTATTTKPQLLVEQSGATTTGWSTSGTSLGVNSASSFAGRLIDLQFDGTTKFNVDNTGTTTAAGKFISNATSDQLQLQSYTSSGKTWRLGTAIGASGNNRNFTIWESDLGNALTILQSNGNVGIGTTAPTSILHTVASGAKTADYVGNLLTNTTTSSTASVVKTGLSVSSTGTWDGTTAVNRGLYVNATGGTTNYAAIFEGGNVGIGTTAPTRQLQITGQASFGTQGSGAANIPTLYLYSPSVGGPGSGGITNTGLSVQGPTGSNNTSGVLTNNGILIGGGSGGAASSGGTVNNYGINLTLASGTTTGTNNYGYYITGNGSLSATSNYSFYNNSAADSYFAGNVGIGTTAPANKLEVQSTTGPQLRVAYDASNYFTQSVSSAGAITFDATGASAGFTFSDGVTVAGHILPSANDTYDLGSDGARWRDLYLGAETLHIGTSTSDEGYLSYTTSSNVLNLQSTGNISLQPTSGSVGIGTTAPDATFHVRGRDGAIGEHAPLSFNVVGGNGGTSVGLGGKNGGGITLTSGNGSADGLAAGGSAGNITITGGTGGNGDTGGAGGTLTFNGGAGGSGGTPGGTGNIILANLRGYVGIGMTNPSVALDVTGDVEYTGTFTDVSDERLKENVKPITSALSVLSHIDGKSFTMIGDDRVEYGFMAQNVKQYIPEAVSFINPGTDLMGVNYFAFTPFMVEAIKEQQVQIEALQKVANYIQLPTSDAGALTFLSPLHAPEIFTPLLRADALEITGITFATGTDVRVATEAIASLTDRVVTIENSLRDAQTQIAGLDAQVRSLVAASPSASLATSNATMVQALVETGGLTVTGDATFEGVAYFKGAAAFFDSILMLGRVTYEDQDIAGYARVTAGMDRVEVVFDKPYRFTPIVNISARSKAPTDRYWITNETESGFTIEIDQMATEDLEFAWVTTAVKNPRTVLSSDATASASLSPTATPSGTLAP